MDRKRLSPREQLIIDLSVEGHTNDEMAQQLGISIGEVHNCWLRIRLKVVRLGRTEPETVEAGDKSNESGKEVNDDVNSLSKKKSPVRDDLLESRAALALFQYAMDQITSTVWATDGDLVIHILANGEAASIHSGVTWEVGKTVYDMFKTKVTTDLAIAAHMKALQGEEVETRLKGKFSNMTLRVMPLTDESGDILGSISVMTPDGNAAS